MKIRIIFCATMALVGLSLFLFWLVRLIPSSERSEFPSSAVPSKGLSKQETTHEPHASAITSKSPTLNETARLEQLRELARLSNKPIEFFGLVLDQNDNPIADVTVRLSIRTAREVRFGVIDDLFEYPVVTTDENGRFALTDARGALLSVRSLDKTGYEASEKSLDRAHYWYWRDSSQVFEPRADRPEIFRMWKRAGAEELVRRGIGHAIPYDGTPTDFDLIEGRVTTRGGDLRVSLVRNPRQIHWGRRNFEWTATIEALDGGLVRSNSEQMYRAPADGYQQRIVFHMSADDPNWTDSGEVAVYLKLRGGSYYGRAVLKFMAGADRPTTPFSITSFVNPSGSDNLEYDPMQNVSRPRPSVSNP